MGTPIHETSRRPEAEPPDPGGRGECSLAYAGGDGVTKLWDVSPEGSRELLTVAPGGPASFARTAPTGSCSRPVRTRAQWPCGTPPPRGAHVPEVRLDGVDRAERVGAVPRGRVEVVGVNARRGQHGLTAMVGISRHVLRAGEAERPPAPWLLAAGCPGSGSRTDRSRSSRRWTVSRWVCCRPRPTCRPACPRR